MNGRPQKYLPRKISVKVLDLIPADGTSKRFKELEAEGKKNGISYRILRQELKRLEKAGTVLREAVKAERGAGTCYRRNMFLNNKLASELASELPLSIFTESKIKAYQIQHEEEYEVSAKEKEEPLYVAKRADNRAMKGSQIINNALEMLKLTIRDELAEYSNNPDTESAEMRFDSVLEDFIVPLIKQLGPYALIPGALDDKAREVVDRITVEACMRHDDIWNPDEYISDSGSS
jgi:hypothetical protein